MEFWRQDLGVAGKVVGYLLDLMINDLGMSLEPAVCCLIGVLCFANFSGVLG